MSTKADEDFIVSRGALERRVKDYVGDDPAAPARHSKLSADLHGLPPTLIQAGTRETLLDDATSLAAAD